MTIVSGALLVCINVVSSERIEHSPLQSLHQFFVVSRFLSHTLWQTVAPSSLLTFRLYVAFLFLLRNVKHESSRDEWIVGTRIIFAHCQMSSVIAVCARTKRFLHIQTARTFATEHDCIFVVTARRYFPVFSKTPTDNDAARMHSQLVELFALIFSSIAKTEREAPLLFQWLFASFKFIAAANNEMERGIHYALHSTTTIVRRNDMHGWELRQK